MTRATDAAFQRSLWIEAFVDHVVSEEPDAPMHRLAAAASRLYGLLGQFDPIDVAEAEWNELRLRLGLVPPSPAIAPLRD